MTSTAELKPSPLIKAKQFNWIVRAQQYLAENPKRKGITLIWVGLIDLRQVQIRRAVHTLSFIDESRTVHIDAESGIPVQYGFECIHDPLLQYQERAYRYLNVLIQETISSKGTHTVSLLLPTTPNEIGYAAREINVSDEPGFIEWSTRLMEHHRREIILKKVLH